MELKEFNPTQEEFNSMQYATIATEKGEMKFKLIECECKISAMVTR